MNERNAKNILGKMNMLVLENHFSSFSPCTAYKHYYPMFVVVSDMPSYSEKVTFPYRKVTILHVLHKFGDML